MWNLAGVFSSIPGAINKIMDNIKVFQSVAALANYIESGKVAGVFVGKTQHSESSDKDFSGTENITEALSLLKYGWHEGAARVRGFMAESGNFESISEPEIVPGVVGFCPCVPAYLAGVPQNMLCLESVPTDRKVTTIVYNTAVGCDVNSKDIEKAAARLFNVVAGLESQGVGVELWAVNIAGYDDEKNAIGVKIKSAGDSFSVLNSVFPCVHPSFCRRIVFRSIEIAGFNNLYWSFGYGQPITDGKKQNDLLNKMGLESKNVFSYYNLSGKTEKEILSMIK